MEKIQWRTLATPNRINRSRHTRQSQNRQKLPLWGSWCQLRRSVADDGKRQCTVADSSEMGGLGGRGQYGSMLHWSVADLCFKVKNVPFFKASNRFKNYQKSTQIPKGILFDDPKNARFRLRFHTFGTFSLSKNIKQWPAKMFHFLIQLIEFVRKKWPQKVSHFDTSELRCLKDVSCEMHFLAPLQKLKKAHIKGSQNW